MRLSDCRKEIDRIDRELVKLLNERIEVVLRIGELKNRTRAKIFVPSREQDVYARVRAANDGQISDKALESIWREIMSACLAAEKPIRVACLGPEGTFSHITAVEKFGTSVEYTTTRSIESVFKEVASHNADYGVVPVENSLQGNIPDTLDMFIEHRLNVCSETRLLIEHCLLAKCSLKRIKKVFSKPIAISQCRNWLAANLPNVELVDASSTTEAAKIAAHTAGAAAIAHRAAADRHGLRVLAESIQDRNDNVTRFFVIGHEMSMQPSGHDKTALMFSAKHKPGSLCDALVPFKRNGVNITKLQSRPFRQRPWEYYFFIEVDGHCEKQKVARALKALEPKCSYLQVLGSFPAANDSKQTGQKKNNKKKTNKATPKKGA